MPTPSGSDVLSSADHDHRRGGGSRSSMPTSSRSMTTGCCGITIVSKDKPIDVPTLSGSDVSPSADRADDVGAADRALDATRGSSVANERGNSIANDNGNSCGNSSSSSIVREDSSYTAERVPRSGVGSCCGTMTSAGGVGITGSGVMADNSERRYQKARADEQLSVYDGAHFDGTPDVASVGNRSMVRHSC